MKAVTTGRVLMTLIALFWGIGACAADFNDTHAFNPSWPPHARFHAVFQLFVVLATNTVALWAIWSGRHALGSTLTAIYPLAFFPSALIPGVAFVDPGQPPRELAGVPGQLVMAAVTLVLLAVGLLLTRRPWLNDSPVR